MRFTRDQNAPHAAAWRAFYRRVGSSDAVGIWHETYLVEPGQAEAVYGNMPRFGLAKAATHVPIGSHNRTAKRRLAAGRAAAERAAADS